MQFRQENILTFFDSTQRYFIIPVYQRAYSWEKREWQTFLDDLKEQIEGDNNYFFGNILLEQIKEGIEYEIIDGQQRLLTLTIFMRALINVFEKRKESGEKIDVDIESKKSIYLKHNGNIKLRPVDYDRACFEDLIINNRDFETNSISQKRMKEAKIFFTEELNNEKTETLLNILDKLEKTKLITIELVGKKDSALMFELQNNRGKDLTNMEKLKSYFIYQMYVYSPKDETETNIEYVSNIFKQIYLIINDLKELEEDSILIYHSYAYIKGYYYRTISDIKDTFKNSTKDKVEWIKDFVNELHTTFTNFKQLENSNLTYYQDLKRLKIPAFVYPFIVKGYKFFGDSSEKLNSLFNILEVLVFRYQLINSRADILSRLNEILLNFNGDLKKLKIDLQNKLNETWYWSDERISEYLNSGMYENRVLHYLLWKYEDYIQSEGYNIKNISLENEQIEHISPQFKNEYLNCLGNLMLISGSHNSSIGNKPFKEKLKSYINNPLLKQQAEIKDFISGNLENPLWDKTAIDKRHKKIVDFAEKKWSFDNLII
jgi:uncharacterized protein with ParB-like and HNH nuclease domain